MDNIKTILLIGRTGNGKSTLANVLLGETGENGDFKQSFKEGKFVVSETKKVQIKEFTEDGISYRIVDTVGVGDTSMTLDQVLRKLALMGYSVRDGLSQILFVTDGRLEKEAKSTYDLLKKVVFDENIYKYTTVVRTHFGGYWNERKQEEEKNSMINNSEEFKELVEECNKIIYVDNPPVDIVGDDKRVALNVRRRKESRKILLDHLKVVCQDNIPVYKPKNLIELGNSRIGVYEGEKEKRKKSTFDLINKTKNNILRRRITREMVNHIEKINPVLKEEIQGKLDELWKKEDHEQTKAFEEQGSKVFVWKWKK